MVDKRVALSSKFYESVKKRYMTPKQRRRLPNLIFLKNNASMFMTQTIHNKKYLHIDKQKTFLVQKKILSSVHYLDVSKKYTNILNTLQKKILNYFPSVGKVYIQKEKSPNQQNIKTTKLFFRQTFSHTKEKDIEHLSIQNIELLHNQINEIKEEIKKERTKYKEKQLISQEEIVVKKIEKFIYQTKTIKDIGDKLFPVIVKKWKKEYEKQGVFYVR